MFLTGKIPASMGSDGGGRRGSCLTVSGEGGTQKVGSSRRSTPTVELCALKGLDCQLRPLCNVTHHLRLCLHLLPTFRTASKCSWSALLACALRPCKITLYVLPPSLPYVLPFATSTVRFKDVRGMSSCSQAANLLPSPPPRLYTQKFCWKTCLKQRL